MKQMRNSSPPVVPSMDSSHTMDCVVGLGANLGDRWAALERAVSAMAQLGELRGGSSVYETDPVGGPPQPQYLNAAIRLRTHLGPMQLLTELLRIERAAGRERRVRWGPRTLDLDILWISGVTVRAPGLDVPHPRLTTRLFALVPLLEVAPSAVDPRTGVSYEQVVGALAPIGMGRLGRLLAPQATSG
jgi:2-amino-4-hydroxy-6-hydroxymethyldihydropteridine diphosphokinase